MEHGNASTAYEGSVSLSLSALLGTEVAFAACENGPNAGIYVPGASADEWILVDSWCDPDVALLPVLGNEVPMYSPDSGGPGGGGPGGQVQSIGPGADSTEATSGKLPVDLTDRDIHILNDDDDIQVLREVFVTAVNTFSSWNRPPAMHVSIAGPNGGGSVGGGGRPIGRPQARTPDSSVFEDQRPNQTCSVDPAIRQSTAAGYVLAHQGQFQLGDTVVRRFAYGQTPGRAFDFDVYTVISSRQGFVGLRHNSSSCGDTGG